MININQLYWAAGIIEGEGTFIHTRNYLTLRVAMTDEDIINRLQAIFNFGKIIKRKPLKSNEKLMFIWSVTKQVHAAGLMMTLLSLMGKRRSDKIKECLKIWKEKEQKRMNELYCINGHKLEDNIYIHNNVRICKECRKLRSQKYNSLTYRLEKNRRLGYV